MFKLLAHSAPISVSWCWLLGTYASIYVSVHLEDVLQQHSPAWFSKWEPKCVLTEAWIVPWGGEHFFRRTQNVLTTTEKNSSIWTSLKLRTVSWLKKGTIKKVKRHSEDWEKIFTMQVSVQGPKFTIGILQFNKKKTTQLLRKWAKYLNRHVTRGYPNV